MARLIGGQPFGIPSSLTYSGELADKVDFENRVVKEMRSDRDVRVPITFHPEKTLRISVSVRNGNVNIDLPSGAKPVNLTHTDFESM